MSTTTRTIPQAWLAAAAIGLVALFAAGSASTANLGQTAKPTVVLVHGAWADASGWNGVIAELHEDGYPVIAPANPLRSLSGDSAYITSVLAQTPGPLALVGHSYGGAVITNAAAGNPNVKALVYVDAFIPDVGENVLALAGADSKVASSIEFKAIPPFGPNEVEAYIKQDLFRSTFAADVSPRTAALMAAEQRPLALAAGAEPTTATAWSTIPSWAIVGLEDRTIPPAQQLFMANRAGAKVVEIHSSHVAMISHPDAVTRLVERAAATTTAYRRSTR